MNDGTGSWTTPGLLRALKDRDVTRARFRYLRKKYPELLRPQGRVSGMWIWSPGTLALVIELDERVPRKMWRRTELRRALLDAPEPKRDSNPEVDHE